MASFHPGMEIQVLKKPPPAVGSRWMLSTPMGFRRDDGALNELPHRRALHVCAF